MLHKLEINLRNFTREYFQIDYRLFFIFICVLNIALVFLYKYFLISDSMYYVTYGERLSYERITEILDRSKRNEWLIFILLPLFYAIRFLLVAAIITVGAILYEYKRQFKQRLQVIILADIVFILPKFIKFIWFYFFVKDYGLEELSNFYPYALLAWLNEEHIEIYFHYPLYLINLFQFLYVLVLGSGLQSVMNSQKSYSEMLNWVMSTYGVGLLVWAVFVVYIQVILH